MSAGKPAPLVIHGWTVFAHPLFLAQIEALAQQVESLKQKHPVGYVNKNANKRLAAIMKLTFDVIPQDPTRPEYRQGSTLGGLFPGNGCDARQPQGGVRGSGFRPVREAWLCWCGMA